MMRALVLSGGGSHGAYQLGVLQKVMKDEGRDYEILCGVSVGAINCAGLAQFPIGDTKQAWAWLNNLWLGLDTPRVYRKWALWPFSVLRKVSMYDTSPIRDLILKNFDQEAVLRSGRELRLGVVSWETGQYKLATQNSADLGWWVAASSSYPVMFEPVQINGEQWTDGGARNVTPLRAAIDLGAKEIDVVLGSNPDAETRWSPKGQYTQDYLFRFLGIVIDEVIRSDLQCLGIGNPYVELKPEYRDVKIRVQMPRHSMAPYSSLDFSPTNIREMIKLGYKEAYEENF